jgi:hypothetical protein
MEQIEQTWFESIDRPSTMITEKSIETINRIGDVNIAPTVNQINMFVGVSMVEPQPVFQLGSRHRCFPGSGQA